MPEARFRFHSYLNDFLPAARREVDFAYPFDGVRSVKDMIEAAGVPHTEVGLMLVNDAPADFAYHVQDGDLICIYARADQSHQPPSQTPGAVPIAPRFVADIHLGRLVAYLRMIGFDTLYPDDYRDEELARISDTEGRILLTRDVGLLKRRRVTHGHYVRETDSWKQLAEVLSAFQLADQVVLFARCTACNGSLESVDKATIIDQLPPKTQEYYDEFRRCTQCGKPYWKGSHYQRLEQLLGSL